MTAIPGIEGLLVVEMAEGIAGPFCGQLLADLGARVIKIEPPEGDWVRGAGPPFLEGWTPPYLVTNRGKESLCVNLRDERARDAVRRLVAQADVLIVAYRPGAADRLGLGPDDVLADNERLIYCVVSGWGNRGIKRERPGTDTILQGVAGIMSVTGEADGPPARVGTALADTSAGVYATLGIVTMLLRREQTGKGGIVDTSLLESLIHLQSIDFGALFGGENPTRLGSRSSLRVAPAGAFETADGWMVISAHPTRQWIRFTRAIGRPEWAEQPGFATNAERVENFDEVIAAINEVISTQTTAHWIELFEKEGVNAGVINTYTDVENDEHIGDLQMFHAHESERYGAFKFVSMPLTFDLKREPLEVRDPPAKGEHTRAVLAELGVDADTIEALAQEGVIVDSTAVDGVAS